MFSLFEYPAVASIRAEIHPQKLQCIQCPKAFWPLCINRYHHPSCAYCDGCWASPNRVLTIKFELLPQKMPGTNGATPLLLVLITQLTFFLDFTQRCTQSMEDLPPPYTVTVSTAGEVMNSCLVPRSLVWNTGGVNSAVGMSGMTGFEVNPVAMINLSQTIGSVLPFVQTFHLMPSSARDIFETVVLKRIRSKTENSLA